MLVKRDRDLRGPTDMGWLKSMHTFSFGHYMDPHHMGFGPLRVINEDRVIPGAGFGTHPHRNMEIISYVLEGELAHKDSMGTGSVIRAGDVQLMSAGTGVTHSEFNHSQDNKVHFLQIWIMPDQHNTEPGYQQKTFTLNEERNRLHLVVSPDGAEGSLTIRQDARMYAGKLDEGQSVSFATQPERKYWLQVAQGIVTVNGRQSSSGDGFAITAEDEILLESFTDSEVILFDLPCP